MSLFRRLYGSVAKSQLAALRKKTGFPLGKCKEALVANTDDLDAAEKWLYSQAQAEGWAKVELLRSRAANQGLIGLLIRGNRGAMVEVSANKTHHVFKWLQSSAHCFPPHKDMLNFFCARSHNSHSFITCSHPLGSSSVGDLTQVGKVGAPRESRSTQGKNEHPGKRAPRESLRHACLLLLKIVLCVSCRSTVRLILWLGMSTSIRWCLL